MVGNDALTSQVIALVTILVVLGFDAYCLRDVARAEEVRYFPPLYWAIIIVALTPLGGVAYLTYGRVR